MSPQINNFFCKVTRNLAKKLVPIFVSGKSLEPKDFNSDIKFLCEISIVFGQD